MTADDFSDSFYYRPFAPTDERNSGRSDATLGPFLTLHQLAVPLLSLIVSRFDIAAHGRHSKYDRELSSLAVIAWHKFQYPPDLLRQCKDYFHPKAFALSRIKAHWQSRPGIQD
jgi:hypothetical protein